MILNHFPISDTEIIWLYCFFSKLCNEKSFNHGAFTTQQPHPRPYHKQLQGDPGASQEGAEGVVGHRGITKITGLEVKKPLA